ncbi:MAG: amidase [Acidiferrobacteraceae bacterium]|nr:amidase [Acidiferrobacteraceae bacterium]
MSDIGFMSIVDIAKLYRKKLLHPTQVVDEYLNRIAAFDAKLGSYQEVYSTSAKEMAAIAGEVFDSAYPVGPFYGIPFALKDIVHIEGRVTTGGSRAMANSISTETSVVAQRLLRAGGILLGKTKTVEVAMGAWGTNQNFGTPWNPWDSSIARTPGGSSSGSGVAVAAGLAACAIGTDTGGSVRIPSAWCGIVGLKTSEGAISTEGIIPLSHTLDTVGPMGRCVSDVALMYEIMRGLDPTAIETMMVETDGSMVCKEIDIKRMHFGVLSAKERAIVDPEVLDLYDEALKTLKYLGAELSTFNPPISFDKMKAATGTIIFSEGYHHHGEMYENATDLTDSNVRPRIMSGRDISAKDYIEALLNRKIHQKQFLSSMRGLTGLLTPTIAYPAIRLESVDEDSTPAHFTRAGNYLGLCGLSIPMGLTSKGLPAGLQILGRNDEESTVLIVGSAFEEAVAGIGHPNLNNLLN